MRTEKEPTQKELEQITNIDWRDSAQNGLEIIHHKNFNAIRHKKSCNCKYCETDKKLSKTFTEILGGRIE